VLKREFYAAIGTYITIPIYRHLAIAMSRKHLPSGGFKRDYSVENTSVHVDLQSSYTSWTAGSIYARGIEEAPGHVVYRAEGYRKVSCEWHAFLYLAPSSLPPRKRVLDDVTSQATNRATKRPRGGWEGVDKDKDSLF